jgi:PEP-CTERM motif-containing protein
MLKAKALVMAMALPLTLFLTLLAQPQLACADEITFSFIAASNSVTVKAASSGLTLGPALNVLVSDATTGASFPLAGVFNSETGTASSFTVTPTLLVAVYNGSGPDSVLIKDSMGNVLVSGETDDHATFISGLSNGAGAFLAKFSVDSVSPAVLALFGLGPAFEPEGSVSVTSAHGNLVGGTLESVIGGGTVTVTTPAVSVVPEPASLGLIGLGLMGIAYWRGKIK